jgi:hypothetical protein
MQIKTDTYMGKKRRQQRKEWIIAAIRRGERDGNLLLQKLADRYGVTRQYVGWIKKHMRAE